MEAFAERYKLNIIMSEDIKGTISIIINDIPVKEAFKNILRYSDLGYKKEGNVYRIKPIEALLKQESLSQQVEDLKTEIVSLKHADAQRLAKNLSQFKSNIPDSIIEADKWTNSIIVKDTAQRIEEIKKVVSQLDIPTPPKQIEELKQATKIIQLRYSNCKDVADIEALKGKVSIHSQTNSVLITDAPENIPHLVAIINDLDKPIHQILIQAKIVETSKNYSRSFGIQWGGSALPSSGKNFPKVSIGGALGGINYNGTSANYAVNLPASNVLPYGGLDFLVGRLDKNILHVRLSAMEDSGNGRIISQPRITTLDNKEATISHGEIIQLPSAQSDSTTIVTGQQTQSQEFEEREAKTELIVTPHIISGNRIKLTIHIKRDTPDYSRII
ncbi:MAG: secretin and TonB N-terminal domain-containing protein, partial [bacterium]